MPKHILSCFEITNVHNLYIDYHLVDVDGPFDSSLGEGDVADRNLQILLKRIAYEEKIPVGLYSAGRHPVLAVPAYRALKKLEYDLTPDVATLRPQKSQQRLCFGDLTKKTRGIAQSFLGWQIRSSLRSNRHLWSVGPWSYFHRQPLNNKDHDREVDIFDGFSLRLGARNGRLCVWVKLQRCYVESKWMPDAYNEHEMQEKLRMRRVLYHFGHRWYPVQILGPTGKTISQQRFIPNGTGNAISVFDYTKQVVGGAKAPAWIVSLDRESPAITYQNSGNKQKRYGAATLCKVMLSTEDPRVSRLHNYSIRPPDKRIAQIRRVVQKYLQNCSLEGHSIEVSSEPVRLNRRVFAVPAQEFGQGRALRVGRNSSKGQIRLQDLGRKRMELLLDPNGGVAVSNPLDAQYLIVPASQARSIVEDFQKRLEQTTRDILQRSFRFEKIVYQDQGMRSLKQQVDSILRAIDNAHTASGRGVLMLPVNAEKDLHNFLKKKLHEKFQFQCVAARKVSDFYYLRPRGGKRVYSTRNEMGSQYVSYLRYAAMGLLIVNRQWPWVLENGTHYDIYIGLDVLSGTAAFTFFSRGGRTCFLHPVESQQKEKLLRKQVRSVVYEQLKADLKRGTKPPCSIVLRRDGRAFASEQKGFTDAMKRLVAEGYLQSNVRAGVIEIHKTSAEGVRLVEELSDGTLRNPTIGAWEMIDDSKGIVCTTGYPFKFRGTVKPLAVQIVAGNLTLEHVLEDTFAMSQLCWPVPNRCMRLSVDLKLCDDYLRSIAAEADDDGGQFGDDEGEDWRQRIQRMTLPRSA